MAVVAGIKAQNGHEGGKQGQRVKRNDHEAKTEAGREGGGGSCRIEGENDHSLDSIKPRVSSLGGNEIVGSGSDDLLRSKVSDISVNPRFESFRDGFHPDWAPSKARQNRWNQLECEEGVLSKRKQRRRRQRGQRRTPS